MNNIPIARNTDVGVQEMDNEVLIYDFLTNKAYCLNETAALIWQNCDGRKSLSEVTEKVSRELKSPVDEGLVWLALEQLKKDNLVKHELAPPAVFDGMNRREVIKKIGLASMIALPLISAVVAPTPASAQSAVKCALAGSSLGFCPSPGSCAPTCDSSLCCSGTLNIVP